MTTTLAHPFRIDANGAAVTLEQGSTRHAAEACEGQASRLIQKAFTTESTESTESTEKSHQSILSVCSVF